jgi:arylsulfatase A-like enzyme/Flp pilus assembly protein TadD
MKKRLLKQKKGYLKKNYNVNTEFSSIRQNKTSEGHNHKSQKIIHEKRSKTRSKSSLAAQNNIGKKEKKKIANTIFLGKPISITTIIIGVLTIILILLPYIIKYFHQKNNKSNFKEIKKQISLLKRLELNILFFTLDTTRADHLGCYGYKKVETPNIDSLANKGILFTNTICQSSLTLPSHISIFTGTYPFYHGVRDNGGIYLEKDELTLAELLKKSGWVTSAFIGAFVLDSCWGLDQGFDYYYDNFDFSKYKNISLEAVQRQGSEVIETFFEWFEKNYQKKFFSWIHLYDPHDPYDPPNPFKNRYSNGLWGLYDGEIAYVDFLIGKVLEELRKKDLMEKTIIIIVGDHGESLGQHNESTHGFFVYDATILVPLIIYFPSLKIMKMQVTSQVETIDIMPTLLQTLDLPIPRDIQGKSFIPLILGKNSRKNLLAYSETYYPRHSYGWSELKSLRSLKYKYIHAPNPELYDLANDPEEQYNIYKQKIKIGKKFEQKLKILQEKIPAIKGEEKSLQELDEDSREKLMALGYIASYASSLKQNKSKSLPDPKNKIHLHNKMRSVMAQLADERIEEALEEISKVIEEDSGILEARKIRARIFLKLDKLEEAINDCKEALKIDPEYEEVIFILARAYMLQKEIEKAISLLQHAVSISPKRNAVAHLMLGAAYLEKKMLEQAELEIKKALEIRPRIPDAHYDLGLLYEERGDFSRAIEEYKQEIEFQPEAYYAHFSLGVLYEKMDYPDKEIEHLKLAIKYKKDFAKGYVFLARAYLNLGKNFNDVINLANESLKLAPDSEYAPLAHFVLADVYYRLGHKDKYYEELQKSKHIQKKIKKNNQ